MIIRRMNFSRTHYFAGQLLGVDDFQAEQNYLRNKQRFRNLHVYGYGVISGLSITVRTPGPRISLSPGLAIDPMGREICVITPVELTLPSTNNRWQVSVRYVEAEAAPVPSISVDPEQEGATQNSRIEEGVEIIVTPLAATRGHGNRSIASARDTANITGVPLAILHRKGVQWIVIPLCKSSGPKLTRKRQRPPVE